MYVSHVYIIHFLENKLDTFNIMSFKINTIYQTHSYTGKYYFKGLEF